MIITIGDLQKKKINIDDDDDDWKKQTDKQNSIVDSSIVYTSLLCIQ